MFNGNIEELTINNLNFRKVLYTGKNLQLVIMSLKPKENIPKEIHETHDQFIRIEFGECDVVTQNGKIHLKKDHAVVIPAGTEHEIINTSSDKNLKLYTIYAPPEHEPGSTQKNKPTQHGGNVYLLKYLKYHKKNSFN